MRNAVNLVVILALATQVSHAAWVFNDIGKVGDSTLPWMGWVFALSLEASIFLFTVYGRKGVATFFAVVSTLINLLYYWIEVSLSHRFFAMLVISPIIPTTIWYYSELIVMLKDREEEESLPIGGYYSQNLPVQGSSEAASSQPASSQPPLQGAQGVSDSQQGAPVPAVPEPQVAKKRRPNGNTKPRDWEATSSAGEAPGNASSLIDTPRSMDQVGDDWEISDEATPDWRENSRR